MKLSPLDIRKQEFDTALRGYSKDDVEAFLQMVSEQWEDVLDEQRRLEDQVRSLRDKMEHYEQVEEALQEALRTARENSEEKLENAQQKASLMVQEAEARSEEIKREAHEDRELMRRQVDQLQERRDKLVARLRAFLMSEMELLLRFDGEDTEKLREVLPQHLGPRIEGPDAEAGKERSSQAAPAPEQTASPSEATSGPAQDVSSPGATSSKATSSRSKTAGPSPSDSAPSRDAETQAPQPSNFEVPVSKDLSEAPASENSPTKEEASENRWPHQTEVVSPPAPSEPDADRAAEEEPDELADFLEQFEAEQTFDDEVFSQPSEDAAASGAPARRERERGATSGNESSGQEASADSPGEPATATADEIEKIRRILNDME